MRSRVTTIWKATLVSRVPAGERPDPARPVLRIFGQMHRHETREMLMWVLENLPDAEIDADLQVTFRQEADAAAFKVRFG